MLKSKRFTLLATVAALGLVAAACGSSTKSASTNAPTTTQGSAATTTPGAAATTTEGAAATTTPGAAATTTPTASGNVTAGVAYDTGGRGDGTFNDSAGRGLDKAVKELGVKKIELDAIKAEDRKTNLELLVQQKANPIIAVGFLFASDLGPIALANPNTTFAIVDSAVEGNPPNVRALLFAENEGSFLVGAAAALKSKTGHIGFIGGQEVDLIKKFEAGYIAGAKAVNPAIKIESKYLGPAGDNSAWGNVAGAKEIAKGWYDAGADVIYTAAGGSGEGTIAAAVEADKWAIGVDSDQWLLHKPEEQKHILTSMLKHVDVSVFDSIKAVADGDSKGGIITLDLKSDGVGYSTSGGFLDDVKDKLDAYKADIISGKIVVPTKP